MLAEVTGVETVEGQPKNTQGYCSDLRLMDAGAECIPEYLEVVDSNNVAPEQEGGNIGRVVESESLVEASRQGCGLRTLG